jgi:prolyl oligopeptidase
VTQSVLGQIPQREADPPRLTKLWNFERYGVPYKEGGRYFYSRNDGLQNQSVLYTMKSLSDQPRMLLDPNTLSTDGTVALAGTAVSPDGKLLAYRHRRLRLGLERDGTCATSTPARTLDNLIQWVKFSGAAWTADSKGFFYSRYDEPKEATKLADVNYFQKLYFHKLGTNQADDVLVYDRKDQKEWGFGGNTSPTTAAT